MEALTLAFGVILLAELGDKSQLMAIAFAARYRAWMVLLGISLATLLINAASVTVGAAVAAALPARTLQLAGGLLFLGFGALTLLRAEPETSAEPARPDGRLVVFTVGAAYLVAEFGDKTMLATITLAATNSALVVWIGASAAMIAANVVAIGLAALLGTRLPARAMRYLAAGAFLVFGVVLTAEGLGYL